MTVVYSPSKGDDLGTSAEVTSFVGRKTELADVDRLLAAGRLVTVLGPGGVGKTRAARRAARQAAERYPDGVRIVELSELRDPDLLLDTIAARLGLIRPGARPRMDAVLDYLSSRRLLLVLDTCEHLVDACALFTEAVLEQTENVTILATSRQPLDAGGEHTYQLSPLPVPGTGKRPGGPRAPVPLPDSLTGTGNAAELFAQRATAVNPEFKVTAANWPDLLRVCRRLDGIPLAIELAAVRLRVLTMRELAERLDERYDALATRRVGTPRHQTLRTAIEWSYDLCTEAERALWERLSVFAGSFDVAAAREICADHGLRSREIVPALIGLVDKSVIVRDGGRYRMLDTIREFGAGRLTESRQDTIYRGRHVAYFLETARSLAGNFLDHDQPEHMRALRAELGNLRAAMRHGLSSDSERLVRDGAELATALYGYWMVSGRALEGRRWLRLALERLPAGSSSERAWALTVRSSLGPVAGVPAQAVAEGDEAAGMARELGDDGLLGRACLARQFGLIYDGQLEDAHTAGAEARPRLEEAHDRVGLLMLHVQTAHLQNLAGNLQEAVDECGRALAMLGEGSKDRQIGEQWLKGIIYLNAGMALYFQGEREAATRCCVQALSIQPELYDTHNCAYALQGLGWLAADQGRWGRAAWLMGGADVLWRQLGVRLGNNALLEKLHGHTLDRGRRHIGEERFEKLFAEGTRWPLDQLARYAIADADALPGLVGPAPEPEKPEPVKAAARLTRREREIADLVAEGLTNADVAAKLLISKRTVDAHVGHIYAKLGVTSRVQLLNLLLDSGGSGEPQPLRGRAAYAVSPGTCRRRPLPAASKDPPARHQAVRVRHVGDRVAAAVADGDVAVDVDDAGAGGDFQGHLVDIAGGGDPGPDVEELADAGLRRHVPDGADEDQGISALCTELGGASGPLHATRDAIIGSLANRQEDDVTLILARIPR